MKKFKSVITGHLDIIVDNKEDEWEGKIKRWQGVIINGDPEGLRSLAKVLLDMADLNQEKIPNLPVGAKEHIHLRPNLELSKSSVEVIVGRLDGKGTGLFYKGYMPKD